MFCTNCGKEIEEGAALCSNCGTPVPQASKGDATDGGQKTSKTKSGKMGWLLAGIILVIVAVAVGVLLFFHFRNKDSDPDSEQDHITQSREKEDERETEEASVPESSADDGEEGGSETAESETPVVDLEGEEYRESSIQDIMAALDAYQQYLDQSGLSSSWGEDYYGCDLIYLDNDDIPEVVIYGMYEAAGNIILTYDGNQVYDLVLGRLYFEYMERMNRLCNSGGHMGYYFDIVYCIQDGRLTQIGEGQIQEVYVDENGAIIDEEDGYDTQYFWDGQETTYEAYQQALNNVYPADQYPVKAPMYSSFSDVSEAYPSIYAAYYAGIGKLTHILAWMNNPLVSLNSSVSDDLCHEFMLMSLTHIEDIVEYYPDAHMDDWWIYISEEDVKSYLMHSIGKDDISRLVEYAFKDPDNLQAYTNYIDGTFIMTTLDTGDYWIGDPAITTIKQLSDTEIQVSGTIKTYVGSNPNTTLFTVRVTPDAESVWNYRLLKIERWDTYVVPFADSQLLTQEDVSDWSTEQFRIARNEIYARHGRIFEDEQLQEYFESRNWYHGTVSAADFSDSVLNEYEIANRDFLVQYEKDMGY